MAVCLVMLSCVFSNIQDLGLVAMVFHHMSIHLCLKLLTAQTNRLSVVKQAIVFLVDFASTILIPVCGSSSPR